MNCPCKDCDRTQSDKQKCKREGMSGYCYPYLLWNKEIKRIAKEASK